ncbi:MICOS complex subunit mic25a-like [Synchiropus splendidus]|uniref:MICOS complex subunit mic25a-like n=1 Tax=Synchiropus splendidus TaxID=270530 RepID=UPI00237E059A|nr:MICOS complex subunit mic25a-like [Synchiropus splendidus]
MGVGESRTRKVSYGVDDEDRVRILRGIKLSEDVLQRMRGDANVPPGRSSLSASPQVDLGSSNTSHSKPKTPDPKSSSKSESKGEQRRNEWQQNTLNEELDKKAEKEKQQMREEMMKDIRRRKQHEREEAEKTKALAQQLQKKDVQLRAMDAFYKEQLAKLEKKNLSRYEQSKEEFHEAASKAEANVSVCNTTPVCVGLQAQILSCYKENSHQTLRCSDLAKEYMRCIDNAKKTLLANHG